MYYGTFTGRYRAYLPCHRTCSYDIWEFLHRITVPTRAFLLVTYLWAYRPTRVTGVVDYFFVGTRLYLLTS